MRRDIRESRTEDAGYRRDPERNTSPHLVIMSEVVVPFRGPPAWQDYTYIQLRLQLFELIFFFVLLYLWGIHPLAGLDASFPLTAS